MNTVKYRALAKDGTWRYGHYPCLNVDMGNAKYPMDVFWNSFLSSFRRETLGQWSGLLDKQGKEIYEGDIVKQYYGEIYPVEWCDCLSWDSGGSRHPGFYFKGGYEYDRGDLTYGIGFEDVEVIGSIYENPELLTGVKKNE
jgi:uncharacterized phage protein (TIGR01671 family)